MAFRYVRERVMLTPTIIGGRFIIRICVVSFCTHLDRMKMAIEDVRESIAELAGQVGGAFTCRKLSAYRTPSSGHSE